MYVTLKIEEPKMEHIIGIKACYHLTSQQETRVCMATKRQQNCKIEDNKIVGWECHNIVRHTKSTYSEQVLKTKIKSQSTVDCRACKAYKNGR